MDYVTVSQTVKRFENEMKKSKIVSAMSKKTMEMLEKEMNVKCKDTTPDAP